MKVSIEVNGQAHEREQQRLLRVAVTDDVAVEQLAQAQQPVLHRRSV